jgi:hypothetical protein
MGAGFGVRWLWFAGVAGLAVLGGALTGSEPEWRASPLRLVAVALEPGADGRRREITEVAPYGVSVSAGDEQDLDVTD